LAIFLSALILFFILSPGILGKFPPKGNKFIVAIVHALVFSILFSLVMFLIRKNMIFKEGVENTPDRTYYSQYQAQYNSSGTSLTDADIGQICTYTMCGGGSPSSTTPGYSYYDNFMTDCKNACMPTASSNNTTVPDTNKIIPAGPGCYLQSFTNTGNGRLTFDQDKFNACAAPAIGFRVNPEEPNSDWIRVISTTTPPPPTTPPPTTTPPPEILSKLPSTCLKEFTKIEGNNIVSKCRAIDGGYPISSVPISCDKIINNCNGILICGDCPRDFWDGFDDYF
jgi:hypothetical protein